MLDQKYFELLLNKKDSNFNYSVYRPINSPIILYCSETGKPLASIHFFSKGGRSLIAEVPKSLNYQNFCDFQGITTKDGEEFSLVVTNLSNEGMINFEIIGTNKNRDFLGQVNKINTLERGRSHMLECDQRTGKSMILSIAREKDNDSSEGIKMGEIAEKKDDVGTFFSISITPEVTISGDYKDTKWGCLDLIMIREKINENWGGRFLSIGTNEWEDFDENNTVSNTVLEDRTENIPNRRRVKKYAFGGRNRGVQTVGDTLKNANLQLRSESMPNVPVIIPWSLENKSVNTPSEDIFKDSFATNVKSGRDIQVNAREIDLNLDVERRTNPIVLGLSINDKLTFHPNLKEQIMEAANALIDCYLKNRIKEYLKEIEKIYDDGKCSLCLEETPDIVLYNCGHKCLHQSCMSSDLDKCPLCRKFIIAKINVSA